MGGASHCFSFSRSCDCLSAILRLGLGVKATETALIFRKMEEKSAAASRSVMRGRRRNSEEEVLSHSSKKRCVGRENVDQ